MTSVLEKLSGDLDAGAEPGMETVDPRFTEITDLAASEDFATVAARVEELVESGVYDIRLIVFYLFNCFSESGVDVLGEVFTTLRALLGPNKDAVGPVARRERHVGVSVSWLCQTMVDRMAYHESKNDDAWVGWQSLDPARLDEAVAAVDATARDLEDPAFGDTAQVVGHLVRWLRDIRESTDEADQNAEQPTDEATMKDSAEEGARPIAAPAIASAQSSPGSEITLHGSAQLRELLQKLEGFEHLISEGRFDRAALVSDDVLAILEDFDPRLYFPELFASFGRLLSENVGQLESQWENRDTMAWNAMRQFYRVDLAGFVESE